jgi:hypothetical protein
VFSGDRLCKCVVGLHRFGDPVTTNRGLTLRVTPVPPVDTEFAKPSVFVRALSSVSKFYRNEKLNQIVQHADIFVEAIYSIMRAVYYPPIRAIIIVRNRPIWTWFSVAYQTPQRILLTARKFVYFYAIFEWLYWNSHYFWKKSKSNENLKTTITSKNYDKTKNNYRMWNILNIWVAF